MKLGLIGLMSMAVASVFAGSATAAVIMNSESFNSDIAGWTACCAGGPFHVASGGAVDNGGFLEVQRNDAGREPFSHAGVSGSPGMAVGGFGGDLTAVYNNPGQPITIKAWFKNLSTGGDPFTAPAIFQLDAGPKGRWFTILADALSDDWVKFERTIDLGWNDVEALGAGWRMGGGPDSWQDHVSNSDLVFRVGGWDLPAQGDDEVRSMGVDEVMFTQLPEPATASLVLCAAGLLLARRRKA